MGVSRGGVADIGSPPAREMKGVASNSAAATARAHHLNRAGNCFMRQLLIDQGPGQDIMIEQYPMIAHAQTSLCIPVYDQGVNDMFLRMHTGCQCPCVIARK